MNKSRPPIDTLGERINALYADAVIEVDAVALSPEVRYYLQLAANALEEACIHVDRAAVSAASNHSAADVPVVRSLTVGDLWARDIGDTPALKAREVRRVKYANKSLAALQKLVTQAVGKLGKVVNAKKETNPHSIVLTLASRSGSQLALRLRAYRMPALATQTGFILYVDDLRERKIHSLNPEKLTAEQRTKIVSHVKGRLAELDGATRSRKTRRKISAP